MKKIILALTVVASMSMAAEHKVDYPEGYRSWTHAKSMVINGTHSLADPFEGIHHVYANKKAMEGLKSNKYKNGAVFAFDLLSAERVKDVTTEGKRKFVAVMEYNTKKYKNTGNWGFGAYEGDSKTKTIVKDAGVSCYQCHLAVENKSYVFTEYRK